MDIYLVCFYRWILLVVLSVYIVCIFSVSPLYAQQPQSTDIQTHVAKTLSLPQPQARVTIGVQKFRNLKPTQINAISDKASVQSTVNFTDVLLKALNESGWFITTEHSDAVSLLNKRDIKDTLNYTVRNLTTDNEFFLESGVLALDVNMITDEKGNQYFDKAGKLPYQKVNVTIYLRVLSTLSGKILKTIYTSKTIFSQPIDNNSFQIVIFKKPFEAETGTITSLPNQFVVTEAIKQAVQNLIIEGILDGIWSASSNSTLNTTTLLQKYDHEKGDVNEGDMLDNQPQKDLFGMPARVNAPFISIHPYLGGMRYSGDYAQGETKSAYGLSLEMYLEPRVGVQLNGTSGTIASRDLFSVNLTTLEANIIFRPFAYQHWTPLLSGGAGIVSRSGSTPFELKGEKYGQVQGGIGLQYTPKNFFGIRTMVLISQPFTDALDGKIMGSKKDYYTRYTLGLVFHLGRFLIETRSTKYTKVTF